MEEFSFENLKGLLRVAYQLINVPTAMLAALLCLCHSLMNPEMPVHVSRLLFPAIFI
jgi:hypothetical protein